MARAKKAKLKTARKTTRKSTRKPVQRVKKQSTKKTTARKVVAKKATTKKVTTKRATAKKPSRQSSVTVRQQQDSTLPKGGEKLASFNPYDKKEFPKHHAVATMLLAGKRVTYTEIYNATGLSPRTMAQVVQDLEGSNIRVVAMRGNDRKNSYIVESIGKGAKKRKVNPLGL